MVLTHIYCLITDRDRTCITGKLEEKRKATCRITAIETMLCSAPIIARIRWKIPVGASFQRIGSLFGNTHVEAPSTSQTKVF